jgi:L-amino acid N-acyltransferase YncA
MVLAPEHRGRGHGTRFLALVVATLRTDGVRAMHAAVRPGNAAIQATFASAGAVETARVYSFGAGEN